MINWKKLNSTQLDDLGLYAQEEETVLVDPEAEPTSIAFLMFDAQDVFSEKQLGKYKKVTPTEFEVVKTKLYELGRIMSWDDDPEEENDSQ